MTHRVAIIFKQQTISWTLYSTQLYRNSLIIQGSWDLKPQLHVWASPKNVPVIYTCICSYLWMIKCIIILKITSSTQISIISAIHKLQLLLEITVRWVYSYPVHSLWRQQAIQLSFNSGCSPDSIYC